MLNPAGCLLIAFLTGCAGTPSTGPAPAGPAPRTPTIGETACKNAQARFQMMCASQGLPRNMATLTPACLAANDDVHRYCD